MDKQATLDRFKSQLTKKVELMFETPEELDAFQKSITAFDALLDQPGDPLKNLIDFGQNLHDAIFPGGALPDYEPGDMEFIEVGTCDEAVLIAFNNYRPFCADNGKPNPPQDEWAKATAKAATWKQ